MYLSRVELNTDSRETMRALESPNILHGAVEKSFDIYKDRKLWRIDRLNSKCYLLVLSSTKPNFTNLIKQLGYDKQSSAWETKNYDNFLNNIKKDQLWQFRIRANPTRSCKQNSSAQTNSSRGKIFAHVTHDQQKRWLRDRALSHGFILNEDEFDVIHTQWLAFHKEARRDKVTLNTVTFEGVLTISDPIKFRQTLVSGIGRAKAYGCGMITLAKGIHKTDG